MALISSNGLPPACTMCIDFSYFYIFIFVFVFSFSRYSFIHSLFYLYYWYWRLLQNDLLGEWHGWATLKSLRRWERLSKWVDDDGKKTRGKACESVWYSCDSRRESSIVGVKAVKALVPRKWTCGRYSMRMVSSFKRLAWDVGGTKSHDRREF
jgi:hypothetical protein